MKLTVGYVIISKSFYVLNYYDYLLENLDYGVIKMPEEYYNHSNICSLLFDGYIEEAIDVFTEKTEKLTIVPSAKRAYLSSLNLAIYNFILIMEHISLHKCCMDNEQLITTHTTESTSLIGADIIRAYGSDSNYLIEKYKNPHIKAAIAYIHGHLHDTLNLDTVSTAAFIDRVYLCQLFKKEVGTNFNSYVLAQRMKLADKLLAKTTLSIEYIAEHCGYKNPSYFSTCYKKYYGIRPSDVRRTQ